MELVHPLEPTGEESPLARARLHRQLTVEETARRAGISAEEVRWLEEGRVYRFPRPDDALAGAVLYASALGIDNREARDLAGLPVPLSEISRRKIIMARAQREPDLATSLAGSAGRAHDHVQLARAGAAG